MYLDIIKDVFVKGIVLKLLLVKQVVRYCAFFYAYESVFMK